MKINKALVKHETRNMKWMMLYFLLISIAAIIYFIGDLNSHYIEIINRGLIPDTSVVLNSVRNMVELILLPTGFGILLMVYLQFKDSKSVEVGNFLKSLPINNLEYYTTKLLGGLINLTLPTLVLIIGVIFIRNSNMYWISDVHSISLLPELMAKSDSVINLVSIFIMNYMVAVSLYCFLFMIQYIVMNIVGGLVVGSLVWLSPSFILMSVVGLYSDFIYRLEPTLRYKDSVIEKIVEYTQPLLYPIRATFYSLGDGDKKYQEVLNNIQILYYEGLMWKTLIALSIALLSVGSGYVLCKKARVEDSDTFISFRWARRIFVIGVTVCSALLTGIVVQVFIGRFEPLGFIPLQIVMIVGGVLGFIISKKITENKVKQGGII